MEVKWNLLSDTEAGQFVLSEQPLQDNDGTRCGWLDLDQFCSF